MAKIIDTCIVPTTDGPCTANVYRRDRGLVIINQITGEDADGIYRGEPSRYTVAHQASGLAVEKDLKYLQARCLLDALVALPVDWTLPEESLAGHMALIQATIQSAETSERRTPRSILDKIRQSACWRGCTTEGPMMHTFEGVPTSTEPAYRVAHPSGAVAWIKTCAVDQGA